jgi:hypothetical protein
MLIQSFVQYRVKKDIFLYYFSGKRVFFSQILCEVSETALLRAYRFCIQFNQDANHMLRLRS